MDDGYLARAAMLYERKIITEEAFLAMVRSFQRQENIAEYIIEDFLNRVIKPKEFTIEDKKVFLSKLKFNDGLLKYGDGVYKLSDEEIEDWYSKETKGKSRKEIEDVINNKNVVNKEKPETKTVPKEEAKEEKKEPVVEPVSEVPQAEMSTEETPVENDTKERVVSGSWFEEDKSEPTTEKEFEDIKDNVTSPESDSNVHFEEEDPERIERLKKTKGKAKGYFLKGAIFVTIGILMYPTSIGLIGGYLYLANKIKKGEFNPKGKFGQGIKSVVEMVMSIGKPKEEERGKSK